MLQLRNFRPQALWISSHIFDFNCYIPLCLAPTYPSYQDGVPAGGASSYNQFGTARVQQPLQAPQLPYAAGMFSVDMQNENVTLVTTKNTLMLLLQNVFVISAIVIEQFCWLGRLDRYPLIFLSLIFIYLFVSSLYLPTFPRVCSCGGSQLQQPEWGGSSTAVSSSADAICPKYVLGRHPKCTHK